MTQWLKMLNKRYSSINIRTDMALWKQSLHTPCDTTPEDKMKLCKIDMLQYYNMIFYQSSLNRCPDNSEWRSRLSHMWGGYRRASLNLQVKQGIKHHWMQLVRYVSISHIKPTALRSADKTQFKKKTNQHQNKKLGRNGILHAVS